MRWLLLFSAIALAGDSDVRFEGEVLHAELTTSASAATVLAVAQSPSEIARIDGGGTVVTLVKAGTCDRFHYAIPSFIGDVEYDVDFCKTADGSTATLVGEGDMKQYRAAWRVETQGSSTRLQYELEVVPNLRLPKSVIRSSSKSSVKKLFRHLEEEFGGQ